MKTKTYPLKIDEVSYKTLKSICEAKNITIKDGMTAAIGLLIAHNMNLVEIKKSPKHIKIKSIVDSNVDKNGGSNE